MNFGYDFSILHINATSENSAGDCEYPTQELELDRDNEAGSTILIPGQSLQGTGFMVPELRDFVEKRAKSLLGSFDRYTGSHAPYPHISLRAEDVTRLKMAWRAHLFYDRAWHKAFFQRYKDWPGIENIFEPLVGLGFTTAGLIYGGLHALAWFAHFESSTQQLLWRVSACVVMGGFPVFWVLLESVVYIEDHITIISRRDFVFHWSLLTALASVVLAYTLARAYLVIECFINLSYLPAGVYEVPKWASYFPHIS